MQAIDASTNGIVIAGFGFLTLLANQFYQGWSAGRQRRWDIEDMDKKAKAAAEALALHLNATRAALASLVQTTADNLERSTADVAAKVAEKNETLHAQASAARRLIADQVKEVGELASSAYHEANTINIKMAALHQAGLDSVEISRVMLVAAEQIKQKTTEQAQLLVEVGEKADSAYHEANCINSKIADLHKASLDQNTSTDVRLANIDRVGLDTNENVHALRDAASPPKGRRAPAGA